MATAVTIRWNVSPADLAEVRRLSLYPFKPASAELDAEMTANPATIFGGAFREDQPIGCIAVLPEPNHDCTARIRWFGILESERGQGVGGRILSFLVDAAQRSGHDSVVLNAQVHAQPFYQAHGFAAHGAVFQDAGIDHVVMTRNLR